MRRALLPLLLALAGCGGCHDEPDAVAAPAAHEIPDEPAPVAPPTGVRPLEPGEPATPELTGTGGGPGANSFAGVSRASRSLLERCWVDAVREGRAHGPVSGVVSMHAGADGAVTSAHAHLGDGAPDGLDGCLERAAREVRFPVTTEEHDVDVPVGFAIPG